MESWRIMVAAAGGVRLTIHTASAGQGHEMLAATAMEQCRIAVAGSGTLGHGSGAARFKLEPAQGGTVLINARSGEIGGLIAGVGQRVLRGISKHLIAAFITAERAELEGGAKREGCGGAGALPRGTGSTAQ
jgi:carbon monoxide dehydrogenase subunit G